MEIDVFVSHHTSSSLHIVESIVNKLEAAGVRCWYAPRDTEGAYAASIVKAINHCAIFLLILNRPASESVHVLNEIDMVCKRLTRNEDVKILPFHVADDEITDDAQYYLGRMHWIDAMTPPMYKRVDELVDRILPLLGKTMPEIKRQATVAEEKPCKLISRMPQVREVFEGREELLEAIQNTFASGKTALFLEGIGGIGKSELAKQYGVLNKQQFDSVVFASYQGSLQSLLCDDTVFTLENFQPRQNEESEEEYFSRKLTALQKLGTERMLIILDNFDVNDDAQLKNFLEGNYRVIITTRNAHPGYATIKVEAMKDEAVLFDIFEKNYGDTVSDEERECVQEIFAFIEYHTYTIELIAKQMEASFLSASEMLQLLKDGGITAVPEETVAGRTDQKSAFGHLCALFNTSNLNHEEQQLMRYLSLMGIKGIPANRFKEWAQLKNFETVNGLVRKSWVRKESGQKLSLHPLVIEVVHSMLTPSMENSREYLQQMSHFFYTAWHRSYVENMQVLDNLNAVWDYFKNPDAEDIRIWMPLGPIYWQLGFFEESIKKTRFIYDACVKTYGENSLASGYAAKNLAGCYFNSGREQESIPWYKKGLQHMLGAGITEGEDLGMAYEKVARCYSWKYEQDFEKSEALFQKSMDLRQKVLRGYDEGTVPATFMKAEENSQRIARCRIGELYMEMGRMYQLMGDYHRALECTEAYNRNNIECDESENAIAYGFFDIAVSCYHIGKQYAAGQDMSKAEEYWEKAIQNLQDALEINMRMRGALAIDTIDTQEMLGDVYAAMGHWGEASNAYMAVVTMVENLLGPAHERIGRVKEKMNYSIQ